MKNSVHKAIAIVGVGAVMPDAPNLPQFWKNIKEGKYSISEVPKERWDAGLYYDSDRKTPDKTYSKIGGWVKEDGWDPMAWKLPIPPKVSAQMDLTQKWAITAAREALLDYGFPEKQFDKDRTAVILGVAMGGDKHLYSAARIMFPEFANLLDKAPDFAALPENVRNKIIEGMHQNIDDISPGITEDTMPGELSNVVSGRIAALFNFHGPNFIADAACASAMAGISAAIEGLEEYDYDLVVTGGIDANMSPTTFVKFSKIGALSASGTRPYAEGADGFIMGEGAGVFILKRLEDAERDGDKIYAVIRSIAGSSDGKGKGITAPNPIGQKLAVQRAWKNSGVPMSTVGMIEGHGTSTSVGDATELKCLNEVFENENLPTGSVALGSVKSNVGHLKGAAGAAGIMKAAMSLYDKVLPPSVNFNQPNSGFDFGNSPFKVNTELRDWELSNGHPRRCGVSAFGFGGTNFHVVMEEYIPGKITAEEKKREDQFSAPVPENHSSDTVKSPLRGALVQGAESVEALINKLKQLDAKAAAGWTPPLAAPAKEDLEASFRIAIDHENAEDLSGKIKKAIKGLTVNTASLWKPLNANGIFFGKGNDNKTAFLFTGQGSQYVNMLKELREKEQIVKETFDEADKVMTPLLGKPLTEYIFVDGNNKDLVKAAGENLKQTQITQPAMLTADIALYRLMLSYGITPDYVIGHSLGEYGALVASGAISFPEALKAVSARGSEMAKVDVEDTGIMAAVFGSPDDINKVIKDIDGYVEIANINSYGQSVIGGETKPVEAAMKACADAGLHVSQLPVSHAFHTRIVAPASGPLAGVLQKSGLQSPTIPVIANVTGDFYPSGKDKAAEMIDLLSKQVASPVQFVKGINKLYDSGVRTFIEMGPKKALNGFVRDIMNDKEDVLNLFTNHPKVGDISSFNQGLCGLYASGKGKGLEAEIPQQTEIVEKPVEKPIPHTSPAPAPVAKAIPTSNGVHKPETSEDDRFSKLGHLFVDFMDKANSIYTGDQGTRKSHEVWITGASVGLPKVKGVFDDGNVERLLNGEQLITPIPSELQHEMLDKNIRRLVKTGKGGPRFETLSQIEEVVKLAARKNDLDIVRDFDYPEARKAALDSTTELAIGAGIDALRDAGIPLVLHYKTTTTGSKLPEKWCLPESMKDETGVIFASAFPGYNNLITEVSNYFKHKNLTDRIALLEKIQGDLKSQNDNPTLLAELNQLIAQTKQEEAENPYTFDRRFLLRVLSFGHAQFAEYIGARGPNTQVNAACASTTMAMSLAHDWIETGRCKRVIIIAGDDITSDETVHWFSSGFLASGAAATDEKVEDAALPFDKRRHGMLVGMGGAAIVVEEKSKAQERGLSPICEVLATATGNSAFHATRLDVNHICEVMEKLVTEAEEKWGIDRHEIAAQTVFVSHETYTPARGGSASAEVNALRHVFKASADKIVIANTKGMTGHAMAVGIEDVLAIKSLETGLVPPVPNFREIDPDLGQLNLSKGGAYPVNFALRLGAGFGSQISMSLIRWMPTPDLKRRKPNDLGFRYRIADESKWNNWLSQITEKDNPEIEVFKRTLRIKDPMADMIRANGKGEQKTVKTEQTPTPVTSPAPAPVPVATAPTEVIAVSADNVVKDKILAIIAEKTGYPADMLNPELDLEADLGIDTVKQAELFAEIRGEYGIERDENLQLSEFPTLNHIIEFVYSKKPELRQETAAKPVPVSAAPVKSQAASPDVSPTTGGEVQNRIMNLIAEKTGYPVDMLDPDLDLEADLGIDTVKQAELFAEIRGLYGIERDENLQLSEFPTLNHIMQFVYDKKPELKTTVSAPAVQKEVITEQVAAAPVALPAESEGGEVHKTILNLIAEKTGYPVDMLDPELDLEADLGIDTVKQAELFAEIRGVYGIERDETLQLSEFPTLNHIIQFVYTKRPDLEQNAAPVETTVSRPEPQPASPATLTEAPADSSDVMTQIMSLIAEKTGYPVDMLDPDLDLEADLGIDTVKQAELFAEIRGLYGIERDENLQLAEFPTLNHIKQFVMDKKPELSQPQAKSNIVESVASTEPIASAEPVQTNDGEDVKGTVLKLVADKTGYPVDMLDPELDLEADLGIDTVKQAELFAEIRGEYGIERDENLQLADFPTLNHIVQFVFDRRPSKDTPAEVKASNGQMTESVTRAQAESGEDIARRVPVPQLRPDLSLCKPSVVELNESSNIIVMSDEGGAAKPLITQLKKTGSKVCILENIEDTDKVKTQIETWKKEGPIQGVYWLPALDDEGDISKMAYDDWKAATHKRVKMLHTVMQELVSQKENEVFLISASRMGGHFGYDDNGAQAALGGAVSGFTKAYKREYPNAQVKVVDFEKATKPAAIGQTLIRETLFDTGAVEIGYKQKLRWTIGLQEIPFTEEAKGLQLTKDSTFLVTGAAGSITSAIIADLAAASGGTFYLLDLIPEPDRNDPDLIEFQNDKEGLKRKLFTRLQEAGKKATPVEVEKMLAGIERSISALSSIKAIEEAGGKAQYFSIDLLDPKAVAKTIKAITKQTKKIDVLLHAGGIEISRLLPEKSPEEFARVFDIKADGWFNLLSNLSKTPIGATVVFSSIAGRFGNGGQTDYSAANDFLCKSSSSFKTMRKDTLGIAIDWTAWKDIGMAARGSIPTIMKQAGIDMLPPEIGVPFVRKALTSSTEGVEIVAAQSLGMMLDEFDEQGGLNTESGSRIDELVQQSKGVMVQEVLSMGLYSGLTTKASFDPKEQGFLFDHAIGGTPVLPGVMGIEAMVESARILFPELHIKAIEHVDFLAPFKFYKNEPRDVIVNVQYYLDGNDLLACCELKGARKLLGQEEEEVKTHFKAKVRLSKKLIAAKKASTKPGTSKSTVAAEDIYQLYFHGPAYQVLDKSWKKGDEMIGQFAKKLPANHSPEELHTQAAPRLVELCFQTAGIAEMAEAEKMGLPKHVDEIHLYDSPSMRANLFAMVKRENGGYSASIVDKDGKVYLDMKGYSTEEFVSQIEEDKLAPVKKVTG